jgi:hypothetical protein
MPILGGGWDQVGPRSKREYGEGVGSPIEKKFFGFRMEACFSAGVRLVLDKETTGVELARRDPMKPDEAIPPLATNDKGVGQAIKDLSNPPRSDSGTFSEQYCIRAPMVPGNWSLNLSNAVAVVIYEAWRQVDFVKSA